MWCDQQWPFSSGNYFADLSDEGMLCVHKGTAPEVLCTLWCSKNVSSPAPRDTTDGGATVHRQRHALGVYPCSCGMSAWQTTGHDKDSMLADPLFVNATGREHRGTKHVFRLLPGLPAAPRQPGL